MIQFHHKQTKVNFSSFEYMYNIWVSLKVYFFWDFCGGKWQIQISGCVRITQKWLDAVRYTVRSRYAVGMQYAVGIQYAVHSRYAVRSRC